MDDYITTTEAAAITGYTRDGIRNYIRRGKLKPEKFGREYKIPRAWAEAHKRQATITETAAVEGVSPQVIYQRRYRKKVKISQSKLPVDK